MDQWLVCGGYVIGNRACVWLGHVLSLGGWRMLLVIACVWLGHVLSVCVCVWLGHVLRVWCLLPVTHLDDRRYTCYRMYAHTKSGLSPEWVSFDGYDMHSGSVTRLTNQLASQPVNQRTD